MRFGKSTLWKSVWKFWIKLSFGLYDFPNSASPSLHSVNRSLFTTFFILSVSGNLEIIPFVFPSTIGHQLATSFTKSRNGVFIRFCLIFSSHFWRFAIKWWWNTKNFRTIYGSLRKMQNYNIGSPKFASIALTTSLWASVTTFLASSRVWLYFCREML